MKKVLLYTASLVFSCLQVYAQPAFLHSTFTNQSGTSGSSDYSTGFPFESVAQSNYRLVVSNANPGDQYFRFRTTAGTQRQPAADKDVMTLNSATPFTNIQDGSANTYKITVTSASDRYVFRTDAGVTQVAAFRIQGPTIQTIVSHSSPTVVCPGQTVTITATLSDAFSTGQAAYLRYAAGGNFSVNGVVVKMTRSGTSVTATIPATVNTAGTTVSYYLFTSGDFDNSDGSSGTTAPSNANANLYTINLLNNGGANYAYTVAAGWTTAANGDWNAASTWTANAVPSTTESMGTINIGHNVTLTQSATGSTLNVASGKSLTMLTNTLTLSGAAIIDGNLTLAGSSVGQLSAQSLTISSTGAVTNSSSMTGSNKAITLTGTFIIQNNGIYKHNSSSSILIASSYTFSSNSNFEYDKSAFSTTPVYGNLIINTGSSFTASAATINVNGNLIIKGETAFNHTASGTNCNLNLGGSMSVEGKSSYAGSTSNNATIVFTNSGTTGSLLVETGSTGSFYNITVNSGRTVGLQSNISCSGAFTIAGSVNVGTYAVKGTGNIVLSANASLGLGSPDGISTLGASSGNIQLTGSRNYGGGTLVYNGTTNQITGTGCPSSIGTLVIANTGTSANNSVQFSSDLTANHLTLTSGYLDLNGKKLDLNSGAAISATAGDFTSTSSGTLTFKGSATVSGTVNFYPAVVQDQNASSGVNYGTSSTIRNSLQLNTGSFVAGNAPTYSDGSKLIYNTGNTYVIGTEWGAGTSGQGIPYHVQIGNGAAGSGLSFGAITTARQCNGNFTIIDGSTLTLSSNNGGDLKIGGNWTNLNTVTGNGFTHNNRALHFVGSTDQSLQNTSGLLTIGYLLNEKPSGNLILNNNLVLNGTAGGTAQVLQLLGNGGFDLNGKTITINGEQARSILVNANGRQLASSVAGGIIDFASGTGIAGVDVSGSGTLDIGSNLTVRLRKGLDFGSNRTTINGTLELFTGSFCQTNSPVYGPNGKLKYATGAYTTSNEWLAGTTVGAGVPYTVELNLSPASDSVTIPEARTVQGALALTSGKLFLNGKTLTVNGNISGNGTFTGSAESALVLGGTGSSLNFTQSSASTNTLKNLTLNLGASATLGNALSIAAGSTPGAVIVNSGATLASNGNLTLKSDAGGTAYVAPSAGTISGNVTVERYIPAQPSRRYRLLTAPVTGTTINAAWQEDLTMNDGAFVKTGTSITKTPPTGYGTIITGRAQGNAAAANSKGFDFWPAIANNIASIYKYKGAATSTAAGWTALDNTTFNNAFDAQQAYLVFIRGDRSVYGGGAAYGTTLRASGTLKQGSQAVTMIANQSHVILGNPYASSIDFKTFYTDNSSLVKSSFYIWSAKTNSATGTGAYMLARPYTGTGNYPAGSYEYLPNYLNVPPSPLNSIIESGQGFFVMPETTLANNASLNFSENQKATGAPGISVFRTKDGPAISPALLYVDLVGDPNGDSTMLDGVLTQFDASFANAKGDNIDKAINGGENLSVYKTSADYIVTSAPLPKSGDTVQLRIWNTAVQKYRLAFRSMNFAGSGLSAVLDDKFLNTKTPVSLSNNAATTVNFDVTGDPASKDQFRFRLLFNTGTVLPLQVTAITASERNGGISVEWKMENEAGIKWYELEKSGDGRIFQKLATVQARAAAGAQAYESFDASPSPVNHYRIKLVATTGEVKYSPVVKLALRDKRPAVMVYPNPVTGNSFQLQLQNKPAGIYTVTLFSNTGQQMLQATRQHAGGSATGSITVPPALAAGTYKLEVKNASGQKDVIDIHVMR